MGVVAAIGSNVKNVKEGDRVGVPWLHTACGHCKQCMRGWETLCANQQNTGYSVNGGFAEYALADPVFVGHVPDSLDFGAAAPVLCAGVTVYKGLKETEARPGQSVVIVGVGGLGHMAVQYAKAMGLHVIAVDISDDKLRLAEECGAEMTINALKTDPIEEVQKVGGVEGVLATAVSPKSISQGVGMLCPGGTMSIVGLPPGNFELPIFDTVLFRKTIRGSIVGTRLDLQEAIDFAAEGKVHSHFTTDSLDNINSIFDDMREGKIDGRVVMEMNN